MVKKEYGAAVDVLVYRMKAIEKSILDGGSWEKAQHLELVPSLAPTMVNRDEDYMMSKEVELHRKIERPFSGQPRERNPGVSWRPTLPPVIFNRVESPFSELGKGMGAFKGDPKGKGKDLQKGGRGKK